MRITKPFYVGSTEVTVAQFRQFVEESGYKTEAARGLLYGKPYKGGRPISTWRTPHAWRKPEYVQKDDEPVLHVCWRDCVEFCKWLSKKEGREYHLPTEAQWEYACRAGTRGSQCDSYADSQGLEPASAYGVSRCVEDRLLPAPGIIVEVSSDLARPGSRCQWDPPAKNELPVRKDSDSTKVKPFDAVSAQNALAEHR